MPINPQLKKWLILTLKIVVSGICFWYIIKKIDWITAWQTIQRSNPFWLFYAAVFIIGSKVIAAFRLNIYFRSIGAVLRSKVNLKLYWLGMYYNIFLPGGIGGDAYKVVMLNRTYRYSTKMLTASVLLDRASGVAGIGVLTAFYYFGVFKGGNYSYWLLASVLPGGFLYYFIIRQFFPSFVKGFWSTFWLGLSVQLTQVLSIYCLMNSFGISEHHTEYVLIFLISSLVAVLPVTFGPFGAREVVFIWGSHQLGLSQNDSIIISLLFDLISVSISLPGIYWVYNNPLPKAMIAPHEDDKFIKISNDKVNTSANDK